MAWCWSFVVCGLLRVVCCYMCYVSCVSYIVCRCVLFVARVVRCCMFVVGYVVCVVWLCVVGCSV